MTSVTPVNLGMILNHDVQSQRKPTANSKNTKALSTRMRRLEHDLSLGMIRSSSGRRRWRVREFLKFCRRGHGRLAQKLEIVRSSAAANSTASPLPAIRRRDRQHDHVAMA